MKKFLKSPWTISFATALFSFALTLLRDYINGIKLFSTIKNIFTIIYNFLIFILNYQIKVWWLIVFVILMSVIFHFLLKKSNTEESTPYFLNYTEDCFRNWKWTWQWHRNYYNNKYEIYNLRAHCPKCETPMIQDINIYGEIYHCPRCRFVSDYKEHAKEYEVKAMIIDNLDRQKTGEQNETKI